MALDLAVLDAKELVLVVVALLGIVPVISQRSERSRLFTVGYVLLLFGALATNLEALVLGEVLGLLEHAVGIGAAGIVFLYAAYRRRQQLLLGEDEPGGDGVGGNVDGSGVDVGETGEVA